LPPNKNCGYVTGLKVMTDGPVSRGDLVDLEKALRRLIYE